MISLLVVFILCAVPVFSQMVISGKVQANTSWLRLTVPTDSGVSPLEVGTRDLWTSSGYVQLNLETGGQTIKAYVSGSYYVNTPDMNIFLKDGKSDSVAHSAALDRAYVKIRLPWIEGHKMRLNIGKMPVSWGYGKMYNAGDIIFGVLPSDSNSSQSGGLAVTESSLSELRAEADWFVNASLLIVSSIIFEPLLRLPLSLEDFQGTNKQVDTPSFGGRILWTPYWQALESAETGYLASRDGKTHYAYAGLDGNLYVDYNLCAQVRINTDSQNSPDAEWIVSGALAKTFIFTNYDTGYEMPLSIRLESLWIPTQNNHSVLFAFVSAQVTDILSIALNWIGTVHDGTTTNNQASTSHLLSAGVTLIPIQGLEFTLSGLIDVEKPSNMTGIAIGSTYRF